MARQRLAYTTDLTDEEWQMLAPLLAPEKAGGRPRQYPLREVLNGIQYILRSGCAWRVMPHDLPHGQTVYQTWRAWRQDGTWLRMYDQLRDAVRTRLGRQPQPSAAIIAAQTVKPTATGGRTAMTVRGNSTAARAIASWTRQVSSCVSLVHPADLRDAEMAPWLLAAVYELCTRLQHVWADMASRGQRLRTGVIEECGWLLDIVERPRR